VTQASLLRQTKENEGNNPFLVVQWHFAFCVMLSRSLWACCAGETWRYLGVWTWSTASRLWVQSIMSLKGLR